MTKSKTTNSNINKFLGNPPAPGHNEEGAIKSKIMSLVSSMQVKDEENENMKEICKDLKDQHGIEPKVARAVAKILHNGNLEEIEKHAEAVAELHRKLTK